MVKLSNTKIDKMAELCKLLDVYCISFGRSSNINWPEDDSLRVETRSHMKFFIIYVYSCDRLTFPLFYI
jgi:hypothetical protein